MELPRLPEQANDMSPPVRLGNFAFPAAFHALQQLENMGREGNSTGLLGDGLASRGEKRQRICSNSGQLAYHCHSREAMMEIPVGMASKVESTPGLDISSKLRSDSGGEPANLTV